MSGRAAEHWRPDAIACRPTLPSLSAARARAGVFSNVEFRLPNMVVCRLTRSSVGRALDLGVSAVTIRDFLDRHAHPRAAAAGMAVPDNVKDQIYLWEMVSRATFGLPALARAGHQSWLRLPGSTARRSGRGL